MFNKIGKRALLALTFALPFTSVHAEKPSGNWVRSCVWFSIHGHPHPCDADPYLCLSGETVYCKNKRQRYKQQTVPQDPLGHACYQIDDGDFTAC